MDPLTIEEWLQAIERKIREQEYRLQKMEARMRELEERVQVLDAEMRRYRQRMAMLERILIEKGLVPPDFSPYNHWMNILH
ncbi:MAG: hypothetical protein RML46_07515 [Anaerolineae bacterium]|nr:hypothetical protein [Anaerolineae bacterium]MDW8068744.1 hypothetical protein [Anaerolineae bacterium]